MKSSYLHFNPIEFEGFRKQAGLNSFVFGSAFIIRLLIMANSPFGSKEIKQRLKKEGSEVVTKCNYLKMRALDIERRSGKSVILVDNFLENEKEKTGKREIKG